MQVSDQKTLTVKNIFLRFESISVLNQNFYQYCLSAAKDINLTQEKEKLLLLYLKNIQNILDVSKDFKDKLDEHPRYEVYGNNKFKIIYRSQKQLIFCLLNYCALEQFCGNLILIDKKFKIKCHDFQKRIKAHALGLQYHFHTLKNYLPDLMQLFRKILLETTKNLTKTHLHTYEKTMSLENIIMIHFPKLSNCFLNGLILRILYDERDLLCFDKQLDKLSYDLNFIIFSYDVYQKHIIVNLFENNDALLLEKYLSILILQYKKAREFHVKNKQLKESLNKIFFQLTAAIKYKSDVSVLILVLELIFDLNFQNEQFFLLSKLRKILTQQINFYPKKNISRKLFNAAFKSNNFLLMDLCLNITGKNYINCIFEDKSYLLELIFSDKDYDLYDKKNLSIIGKFYNLKDNNQNEIFSKLFLHNGLSDIYVFINYCIGFKEQIKTILLSKIKCSEDMNLSELIKLKFIAQMLRFNTNEIEVLKKRIFDKKSSLGFLSETICFFELEDFNGNKKYLSFLISDMDYFSRNTFLIDALVYIGLSKEEYILNYIIEFFEFYRICELKFLKDLLVKIIMKKITIKSDNIEGLISGVRFLISFLEQNEKAIDTLICNEIKNILNKLRGYILVN